MNIRQFLELISRKKQTIVSVMIVFLAITIVFSATAPFKYSSRLTLLVVHDSGQDSDPYVASRANEYLSDLLSRIVSSGSFFAKVKDSGFNIDKNYFTGTQESIMKKWNKTVKAKSIPGAGSISVTAYHTDRSQSEELARAVAYTLQTANSQYHGFGNSVEIKMIDDPITSNYPVLPDVPFNLGLALAFALIFSLSYIYLFPEERYDLRLWPKAAKEKMVEENNYQADFCEPAMIPEVVAETEEEIGGYAEKENIPDNYQSNNFQNIGSMNNILRR
jgi:capsular polysaccharide biosynthesis protein